MSTKAVVAVLVAILGALLVIPGLVLGTASISVNRVDCGSAFSPRDLDRIEQFSHGIAATCEQRANDRRLVALSLMLMGGVLLVGGAILGALGEESS